MNEHEAKALEMFDIPNSNKEQTLQTEDETPVETKSTEEPTEEETPEEEIKVVETQPSLELSKSDVNKQMIALRQERKAFEAEKAADKAERENAQRLLTQFRQAKELLSQDPEEFLRLFGTDYTKLSQQWLSKQQADPVVNSELQRLKIEQQKIKEQQEKYIREQQAREQQVMIQNYVGQLKEAMKDDKYELCRAHGDEAIEFVFDVQRRRYEQGLDDAPMDELLEKIEEYYLEKATKLTQAKKLQALKQQGNSRSKGSTISTEHQSKLPDAKKVLTQKEREQMALSMFEIR